MHNVVWIVMLIIFFVYEDKIKAMDLEALKMRVNRAGCLIDVR